MLGNRLVLGQVSGRCMPVTMVCFLSGNFEKMARPPGWSECHSEGRSSLSSRGHSCKETRSTSRSRISFESLLLSKSLPPILQVKTRTTPLPTLSGFVSEYRKPMNGPKVMSPPRTMCKRSLGLRHNASGRSGMSGRASIQRGPKSSSVPGHQRSPARYMRARAARVPAR